MKSIHRSLTVSTASGISLHDITPQTRALAAEK
jgi:thiamine phosphate synthase YjbQ (UPF0047 family)